MQMKVVTRSLTQFGGDLIIVNLFEGVKEPGGATGTVDKALGGAIRRAVKSGQITGKLGETLVIQTLGRLGAGQVAVVGLGRSEKFGPNEVRKAAGAAALAARKAKARKVGTIVHGAGIGGLKPESAAQALVEGTILALYRFDVYRESTEPEITEFSILEIDRQRSQQMRSGAALGQITAESQNIARDLVNEPANTLTPMALDQRVRRLLVDFGLAKKIKYQSLTERDIARQKMGALLSVSRGSANRPRFITLRHLRPDRPLICMIGKAVTFDSGGISLKAGEGMFRMKGDMAGGAAVIGATLALARANVDINLLTIVPAVENLPSGTASRPGDIVRASNRKTIEIISTDAEGRMTLADALVYAERHGARIIVDIATLTGGCMIAFGDVTSAVMGNDQRLINSLIATAEECGEHLWQLPLFDEYQERIKSDVADVKNSGGREASPITAGMFLKLFVDKSRWIHIDMAGKEITDREGHMQPRGGTGFGTRTLFEFCRRIA